MDEKGYLKNLDNTPGIDTRKELNKIIEKIADLIAAEDMDTAIALRQWRTKEMSLEKLAQVAELEIRSAQIGKIRAGVLKILKDSTNKLVLAAIKTGRN
jgi:glucan phosphorylase